MNSLGTIVPGVPTVDNNPKPRTLRDQIELDARQVFMNPAGFAQPVSWQPTGEPGRMINGIFDAATPVFDNVHGVGVTLPTLTVATSEVSRAKTGDVVVMNRKQYYVSTVRHDGTGITTLELSEDQDGR